MILFAAFGTTDCSFSPEVDERVDVAIDRVRRIDDAQHVVNKDVRDERTNEKQRGGAGIIDVDDARGFRAREISDENFLAAPRRTVFAARIERNDERRIAADVHRQHDVLRDGLARVRNPSLRELAQYDARVG